MSISGAAFLLNGSRDCCWPLKLMYVPGWMVWLAIQSGHFHGTPFCGTFNEQKPGCCTGKFRDVDGVCDHWDIFGLDIGSSGLTTAEYCWCWWCALENTDGLLEKTKTTKSKTINKHSLIRTSFQSLLGDQLAISITAFLMSQSLLDWNILTL